ncbi:MAG: DUF4834 family protein [Clostridium sp.]|nr:DUF4834 family protein [Clostridium sp.]
MQFLGTLFIIFFIVWLLGQILSRFWPQIAMWLLKRHVKSQMNQAFGPGAYQRAQREYDPFGNFRRQSEKGRKRRRSSKIIDPEVGEYVEFEEVKVTASQQAAEPASFRPEPQIEDADWEDIK